MSERREQNRYSVWFPMKVQTPTIDDDVAVSRNVSDTGLLMVAARVLEVGASITVTFRISKDTPERTMQAKIVRCEPNPESSGLWPYRIAVEFAETHSELEELLREIEAARGVPSAS